MLRVVNQQPAFEMLVHHGGRNCEMQRRGAAISNWFRIQFSFNRRRVIDDLQTCARREGAKIARTLRRRRMMQKFRGKSFDDSINVMHAKLMFIDHQAVGGGLAFEKRDASFNPRNSADQRAGQQRNDAEMRDEKCGVMFAPRPA